MTPLDYTIIFGALVASVVAFCLMGKDKWRARRGGDRTPEATLLLWGACFGALGGWLGMQVFRHKTKKWKFVLTMPVMMVLQLALLAVYFRYWRQYL